jgi:Zn-dependent M28 family amino/carboxypeptidase
LLVALAALLPIRLEAGPDVPGGGWNADRAMADIARQLSFGARAMGTQGHERTIAMIREEFARLGAETRLQTWTEQTPNGPKTLTNVIARFDPANPRRVLLGTHYDSIYRAYNDPRSPQAVMPGANNSASGVALLLETARALKREPAPTGIDFVFFDGEEGPLSLGEGDPNWRALGSPRFVADLKSVYPRAKPDLAVIFDMVCYRNMRLQPEPSSLASAPRQVSAFWRIGHKRAPTIFDSTPGEYGISDDQNAFQSVGVPAMLVIGFEYAPYFNTTQDTIDKCSPAALQAVGDTLMSFLHAH